MNHSFLNHFEDVRCTSDDRNAFIARCPAHDDGKPSLAIADVGNKWILHCWAGCTNGDILAAAGLSWSDLFSDTSKQVKAMGPTAAEKLKVIEHELLVVAIGLNRIIEGAQLAHTATDAGGGIEELKRLQQATRRLAGYASRGR